MVRSVVLVAALTVIVGTGSADANSPPVSVTNADSLAALATVTVGDLAALAMAQQLPAARVMAPGIDLPITFGYDRHERKLVVSIYAENSRYCRDKRPIECAEYSLEYFRKEAFPVLLRMAAVNHQPAPRESDLRLIYFDTSHDLREIVRWEEGRYVVAK
jgi:hypothetical protein